MTAFAEHKLHSGFPGVRAPEGVEGGTGDGIPAPSLADITKPYRERVAAINEIFDRHSVEKYGSLREFQVCGKKGDDNALIDNEVSRKNVWKSLYSGNGVYQVHVTFPEEGPKHRWLVGAFGEMLPTESKEAVAEGKAVEAVRDERLGQLIALIKDLQAAGVKCDVRIYGLPVYNNDWDAGLVVAPQPLPTWWEIRHRTWAEANRNAVCAIFEEAGIEIEAKWDNRNY